MGVFISQGMINVIIFFSDVATPEIVLTKDTLTFKGVAGAEKKEYALTMKFLKVTTFLY